MSRTSRMVAAAGEALWHARLRSSLAVLGLVVGVAAVVVMVALAEGSRNQVMQSYAALGSNLLTVRPPRSAFSGTRGGGGQERALLTPEDAAAISRLSDVTHAVALLSRSVRVGGLVGEPVQTEVVAAGQGIFAIEDQKVEVGRFFSPREVKQGKRVVLLGPTVARALAGPASLVGQRIEINRQPFLVVGELTPKGVGPDGEDLDDRIFIPLRAGMERLTGARRQVDQIMVQARAPQVMPSLEKRIQALMKTRHRLTGPAAKQGFRIRSQQEALEAREEAERLFTSLTLGVAGLSLLVAGIGITAVQLIGVRERTGEIGVRRALGARRRDILGQFLAEGLLLGLAGGLAGAGLGLAAAGAARPLSGLEYALPLWAAGAGVSASLIISLAAGIWPAWRAALMPPAQALTQT